jgi:hypothetical protein
VTFDQDPSVTAMVPVMGNPNGAWTGRPGPMAVNPHITVTIPAVIAVNPNPAVMRWMVVDLDDGRRRRHMNHNRLR